MATTPRTWTRRSAWRCRSSSALIWRSRSRRLPKTCFDIWEEKVSGCHYYAASASGSVGSRRGSSRPDNARARVCRVAADKLAAQLDAFWNGARVLSLAAPRQPAGAARSWISPSFLVCCMPGARAAAWRARPQSSGDAHRPGGAFRSRIRHQPRTSPGRAATRWVATPTTATAVAERISSRRWQRQSSTSGWQERCARGRESQIPGRTGAFCSAWEPRNRRSKVPRWQRLPCSAAMRSCGRCSGTRPSAASFPSTLTAPPALRTLPGICPGAVPAVHRGGEPAVPERSESGCNAGGGLAAINGKNTHAPSACRISTFV